ncbi:MAG: DUF1223 domain-containing protein [Parvularculaceae bacterium]|nr:DUF1223 domain-containing protein [Parvularculaceae bacterium]
MRRSSPVLAIAIAAAAFPAAAAENAEPVVVEMFLSQACSDSPAAAAVQREISKRPDVVALTWHIDYWDVLANRKHGRWEDPFAAAAFSARQRVYNRNIRERSTVFTPQAIVNGAASEVGSRREGIEEHIEFERMNSDDRVSTSIKRVGDMIEAKVDPEGEDPRDVLLVRFASFAATRVGGGDNFGVTFEERNVVRQISRLGMVTHEPETFIFPAPPQGQGCAVIVQHANQGPIVGARYCP